MTVMLEGRYTDAYLAASPFVVSGDQHVELLAWACLRRGAGSERDLSFSDQLLRLVRERREGREGAEKAADGSDRKPRIMVVHAARSVLRMRSRPTSTPGGAAR